MTPRRPVREPKRDGRSDRGVSDIVSFVLVFSLMIVSIAVVTTVGIGSLEDFRDGEQLNSAERVFATTGASIDEVAAAGSPHRTSDVNLRGGTLFVRTTGPSITVTVGGNTYPSGYDRTNALVYRLDGSSFVYASGALIRSSSDGGAVVVDSPRFTCSPDGAVVSLVHVEAIGPSSVGSGTARIDVRRNSSELLFPASGGSPSGGAPVELEVDATNAAAWNETLTSPALGWSNPDGDDVFECSTDRVFVRRTNVTVDFVS